MSGSFKKKKTSLLCDKSLLNSLKRAKSPFEVKKPGNEDRNMAELAILAKLLDTHGTTLVHVTYPLLKIAV